jgi:inosine-uridine nucleoside N-ribohydrolase
MGGAFDVAGNAPNGSAEWNYFVDPAAVDVVVKSGLPLTIVPLDATDEVPVNEAWFSRLADHHGSPSASAVFDLYRSGRPWETGFSFWDELTAAIAVDESLAVFDQRLVAVVTDASDAGWSDLGRTVMATGGDPVRVASQPDRQRFEAELLSTLAEGG